MTESTLDFRLVELALEKCDPVAFERFGQSLFASLYGETFVATGGMHDGGADGMFENDVFEVQTPGRFLQISKQEDHRAKIRKTVTDLRKSGRKPAEIFYLTSRLVPKPDIEAEKLQKELGISVRIRGKTWIVDNTNHSAQTREAFYSYLQPSISYISSAGGAAFVSNTINGIETTVAVFLSQEVERRSSKSNLVESISDSLILWGLNDTDPDQGRFMSRAELLQHIIKSFPAANQFIKGVFDHRLSQLASKINTVGREIRWYRKEDKFCLPAQTREIIKQENIEDESLRISVLDGFRVKAVEFKRSFGVEVDTESAARFALESIELAFRRQGLEMAEFLSEKPTDYTPSMYDHMIEALRGSGLEVDDQRGLSDCIMSIIRQAFYDSTPNERLLFGKLSRLYCLLLSIQAEPKLVEFFQGMSSRFNLFVGTDILIRALSEHFLKKTDQMTCNLLEILSKAGSTLVLTEPVLEEIHYHLKTTDWEFRNHYSQIEPYVDRYVAAESAKILVRAYFYAKLSALDGIRPPNGWKAFMGQWCDYETLHSQKCKEQLRRYLLERFGMTYLSQAELVHEGLGAEVNQIAEKLLELEIKSDTVLAKNDACLISAVYWNRTKNHEDRGSNPYGFATWWLTHESRIQLATWELVRKHGTHYIIRPEFILNFILMSPNAEEVKRTYATIFPSLLGIKLANRVKEEVVQDVLKRANEMAQVDSARMKVMVQDFSNQLKSDKKKIYQHSFADTNPAVR